jgi:hypothetical protein
MAWIYLAESGGFHSGFLHGYPQSLIVRQTDTARECFYREWRDANSPKPRYGTMLEPLQDRDCLASSISFPAASHARTSVLQELERAWTESEADWLEKCFGLLASFDRDLFSWKTCQLSLFEGMTSLSAAWPRWGMTVDGRFYQPESLEPVTCVKDGGYLPTPTAKNYGHNQSASDGARKRYSLHRIAMKGELLGHPQGCLNPEWIEQAMGYPIGHTDIEPWVMQLFRKPRARRSKD